MTAHLDFSGVLGRVFTYYRNAAGTLLPAALIVFVVADLISAILVGSGGLFLGLLATVIGIIASFWYQGVVVEATRDLRERGSVPPIGQLFSTVTPFLGSLILAGLLAGLGIMVGFVLLIVPGLILLTIWSLIAPVIVLERKDAVAALGRSRELVRGNGLTVFGIIVTLTLLAIVVTGVLQAIFSGGFAGYLIGALAGHVLVAPLSGLAVTTIYLDLVAPAASDPAVGDVPPATA